MAKTTRKKETSTILSSEFEKEIRRIVKDEMKKSTVKEAANLMNAINEKIAECIKNHFISLSKYTIKTFNEGD